MVFNLTNKISLDRTEWRHEVHVVTPQSLRLSVDDESNST